MAVGDPGRVSPGTLVGVNATARREALLHRDEKRHSRTPGVCVPERSDRRRDSTHLSPTVAYRFV
jgi:hypothetical protein